MIAKEIALTRPNELWHSTLKNADGTPMRVRSSGQCKTWKTRPDDFVLPTKRGVYQHLHITPANAHEWSLPDRWPVERHAK
jgi:hypothetical protein